MNLLFWGVTGLLFIWQALELCLYADGAIRVKLAHLLAAAAGLLLGTVVSATLLAILGAYSLLGCCALLVVALAVVRVYMRLRHSMPLFTFAVPGALRRSLRLPAGATMAALVVVLAAGMLYVLFPTNYLFGGRDYGLYEINAVHISNTGGYQYESDSFYTGRYDDVKDFVKLAYPALFNAAQEGITQDLGKLDPQFLPMASAGMAVLYGLLGFTGLLRFNALVSIVSLLALFLLARSLFGKHVALLATVFMAVCPAQLWGARISGSEQLAQLLFLLAGYCVALGIRKNHDGWLLAAGVLVGVGCFNRIDNYVLLIGLYGIACYCLLWLPQKAMGMLKGAAVATLLAAVSVWYGFTWHPFYFVEHWNKNVLNLLLFGCGACLALTLLLAVLQKPLRRLRVPDPLLAAGGKIPAAVICSALLLLFLFTYFLRPLQGSFDSRSMVEFSWYISVLAVPLAIVGLHHLLRSRDAGGLQPGLFLWLCGLGSVFMYTWRPAISEDHFWAGRRWVPVNNPFLLILAAAGVVALWRVGRACTGKKLLAVGTKVLSVGCAVFMAGFMLWQCRLFLTTTMFAGINGQYAALAASLPDDELVITGDANIASVLKYVYNKPVYLWNNTSEEIEAIRENGEIPLSDTPLSLEAAESYLEKSGGLYIVGSPGRFWQQGNIEQVYDSVLAGNYPETSIGSYPKELDRWEFDVAVYRLTPSDEAKSFDFLRGQVMGNASTRHEDWSISLDRIETVFYGPYTSLRAGSYRLEMDLEGDEDFDARLDITLEVGTYVVTSEELHGPGTYVVEFGFDEDKDGLEFALHNLGYSLVKCTRLELFEADA